jgi:uncharacterized phage-associated protein
MTYDARALANLFLDYADAKDVKVTLLALMKMIYYAHGWYLAKFGQPLVRQPFEAWKNGPVVRIVWEEFKGNKGNALTARAERLDVLTNRSTIVEYKDMAPEVADFLRGIFNAYSKIHAVELSNMTHAKGSPWDIVWNDSSGSIKIGMQISNDIIRGWFSDKRIGILH